MQPRSTPSAISLDGPGSCSTGIITTRGFNTQRSIRDGFLGVTGIVFTGASLLPFLTLNLRGSHSRLSVSNSGTSFSLTTSIERIAATDLIGQIPFNEVTPGTQALPSHSCTTVDITGIMVVDMVDPGGVNCTLSISGLTTSLPSEVSSFSSSAGMPSVV